MANSNIPTVQLTDTFNTIRNRFNSLVDSVGNVSTLTTTSKEVTGAIKELDAELGTISAGAMGTTASTVSTAIAEIDGRLDSISSSSLLSPRMTLSDSSATSIIRGNLQVDTNLSVKGDLTFENTLTVEDSAYITGVLDLGSHLNVAGDTTFANTITVQDSAYVTGTLTTGSLVTDNNLTVHGIANLDSTNVVGQLDVTGSITATNFTVSGAFTTAGATRNAASFVVTNDGATVTNTNRAGLSVDRPSLDSAVLQWNELGDFWEIGTNQTDGGSSSDLKRVARQNDSAVFSNLMQSGTGATRIPAGTTAQRPSAEQGQIRYNTTNSSFEGYSGSAWSGLGGLIDVDGDTKIIAERSASSDSDTLTFFTAGVERLRMNDSGATFTTNISTNSNISGTTATFSGNITMTGSATVDGRDLATDGTKLDTVDTNANNFSLPTAAAGTKGGVKVGDGLTITSEVLSHTDTSSQASSNNSGRTYIQDITLDTYGHVTGIATATETVVDTNTEYTVGDGGLTQKNFTTALNTKLSGIASSANNYSHPTHPGDDISIDTTALSGATVISDLDFNITTDTEGHVTDANGSVATRTITLADLGYTGATNANNITNNNQLTNGAGYVTSSSVIDSDVRTLLKVGPHKGVGTITSGPTITTGSTGVFGNDMTNYGPSLLAIGANAEATHWQSMAVGQGAQAKGTYAIAIGRSALALNHAGIAIGEDANCMAEAGTQNEDDFTRGNHIAIGSNSRSSGYDQIAIGTGADNFYNSGYHASAISIGHDAVAGAGQAVSMGELASSGTYSVAIGYKAHAGYKGKDGSAWTSSLVKSSCVAIGYNANAGGNYNMALGASSDASDTNQALNYSVSLGYGAKNYSQGNWTMTIGSNGDFNSGIKAIYPGRTTANGYTDLGAVGYRFGQLFVQTSTSVGSDERLKKDISVLSDAELRVANALRIKKYKLRAEAKPATTAQPLIEHEDSDGNMVIDQQLEIDAPAIAAKIRIGVIAQEVVAAFSAEGLDAMDYGIISGGTVADDDNMLGVSYDELEAFILAAHMQRLNDLEARIAALE